jgi:hypothetical protein
VPGRIKASVALRVVVNNIYARNLAVLVYIHMVVGNLTSVFLDEVIAVTQMVGHFPDFLHGIVCRLLGERFVVECGILSAFLWLYKHLKKEQVR